MAKVYIVSERQYIRAFHCEPFRMEQIIRVFDDYHKAVGFICDTIKKDHERIDESMNNRGRYDKYEPNPDKFEEGHFITSFEYGNNEYCESKSYRFRSYEVE